MSHTYARAIPVGYPRAQPRASTMEATKTQFRWLCALVLSFCYELPLFQVTSFDRLNPRLFDIVTVFGFLIFLFQNHNFQRAFNNPVFKRWFWVVVWFGVCAVVWACLWLPWEEAGVYSLFFAGKYIQGLFCIYLVASIPLSGKQKHLLHWMVVFGGVVVAVYAIYEKFLLAGTPRKIANGKEIITAEGTLFSCLGPIYFHVATFSSVASAMTFALTNKYQASTKKMMLFATALFIAWPAVFCGSRTGLVMVLIILAAVFLYMERTRITLFLSLILAVGAVLSMFTSSEFVERASDASLSVQRLITSESSRGRANGIAARLQLGIFAVTGHGNDYEWQGARMPFLGGGFYTVPFSEGGRITKFRIGYGIHNSYLFPYEQAGILGILLSGIWFVATFKCLRRFRKSANPDDKEFATGAWCLFIALIPVACVGQIFWSWAGTENVNTFLLVLLVLGCKPSTNQSNMRTRPQAIHR